MNTTGLNKPAPRLIWDGKPEPDVDVWWGEEGIDALIWPKPYMVPSSEPLVEAERDVRLRVLAGDA